MDPDAATASDTPVAAQDVEGAVHGAVAQAGAGGDTASPAATSRVEGRAPAAPVAGEAAPVSSAAEEMPPAAQLRRPATPRAVAVQATTTSSPKSTFHLTQTELADDSPDPLRIIPTSSAASSAARTASPSSPSAGLGDEQTQVSPTRLVVPRRRSKTPAAAHDRTGENLDPSTAPSTSHRSGRAPSASLASSKLRAMSAVLEAGDSDDELRLSGAHAAFASRRSSGTSSRFDYVEIPVAHGSTGMLRTASGSSRGTGAKEGSPTTAHALGKAGKKEPSFEIVLPASRSRQTTSSPNRSPRASPKPAASTSATSLAASSPPATHLAAHPLSQAQNAIPPSSPLTSLPPSQLDRTSPTSPRPFPSPPIRPKRTRRSSGAVNAAATTQAEEGEHASEPERSSATEQASPKKKARRPAPTVKKDVAVPPAARLPAALRGKGKSKASEPEPEPDSASEAEEEAPPPKAKAPPKSRRKSAAKEPEREEDKAPKAAAADGGRGTRRRQSFRATLKEDSSSSEDGGDSEDGDDGESSDGFVAKVRASPKKRGRPPKADPHSSVSGTPKRVKADKGKAVKAKGGKEASPPASSPSKSSFLPPPGSFGSQLLGNDRAAVETSEQRAKTWSLNALPRDRPIWAHVRKDEKDCFWWPAQLDCGHWEKPLRVKLYLDPEFAILEYSSETLTFDSPDHDDLVTFRNPAKLRFDQHTFRDSTDAPTPPDAIFARVLESAIEKDAALDDEDDEDAGEDEDGMLLPPSSFGANMSKTSRASQSNGKAARNGKARAHSSDSGASSEEEKVHAEDDDEQWLNGGGEDAGMTFPFYCLAQQKRTWWAARAARYEPPSPTKAGAKRPNPGKFVVEWTDGSIGRVTRKNLLTPTDSAFFTVKMGETELDVPKSYVSKLRAFCSEALPPKFQKIIDEDLALAQELNDAFFAGGSRRNQLAKKSAFGEMTVDSLEEVQDAIDCWASGAANGGERPKGSARYEALGPRERNQYRVDVLLSVAVALNYVDDQQLADKAEEDLKARGVADPTDDAIEEEAFKLARSELDLRSATKTSASRPFRPPADLLISNSRPAVLAMRQSRSIVDASRKQKEAAGGRKKTR